MIHLTKRFLTAQPGLPLVALTLVASLAFSSGAEAQEAGGLLSDLAQGLNNAAPGSDASASLSGRIIQLIALMTVLSIAPGVLVVMTSFTRFVIVFSMLRSALGLNQTPPNMVLSAMALFMTFFVMQPVFDDAWTGGLRPLLNNTVTEEQALVGIGAPFKAFMFANTRPKDLKLFADLVRDNEAGQNAEPAPETPAPATAEEANWRTLVPAFMISELRRAFTIGFLIYLPFIAIDLIVASVLMSAGMMMLPPVMISLPFKVIFFVLIDGWYMLAGSMMQSYVAYGGGG
ncbi:MULTISPECIES: flagellar type III secretion system pore protein FliP [Thioclava]|uniref:flagellar type III secretion system pore protein FliP n=1 Tax=Thioclava TaxID=285107 RepID=UPI000B54530A|nr:MULTISPECIES: flagellar type III secretion system pore protein FliP [Thioclava]OWY00889.1 flagellar biosynthetic protein FliP [Thioclava sp. IC9]OWY08575.1 flagellar biosynthetic protein FliP [Thioclava sp. F42-5]OWY15742.1 flagellar biosynthetic protein FliP [Thioclava sp. JM3]PWE49448.1 flagellar biosynthetic protein FliP [Thioclava sp. NG1]WGT51731.1 flagellar type III secretion system pore protein FliP [Thioclava nitratireducens]